MGVHHVLANVQDFQAKKYSHFFRWIDPGGSHACPPRSPDLISSKFYISIQIKSLMDNRKTDNSQGLSRKVGYLMLLGECRAFKL